MDKSAKDRAIAMSAKHVAQSTARRIGKSATEPGTLRLAHALNTPDRARGFTDDPFDGGCPADSDGGAR